MFREINIRKLCMLWCRQYWSVTQQLTLSLFYRYIYGVLSALQTGWSDFAAFRLREKKMALIQWTWGAAVQYLKDTYSQDILLGYLNSDEGVWLTAEGSASTPVWLSSESENRPVWLSSTEGSDVAMNILIISIPRSIYLQKNIYNQLIADINTLIISGINYKIEIV